MKRSTLLLVLLIGFNLQADGVETAIGMGIGPTHRAAPPGSRGDNTTALLVRLGWDQALSHVRQNQWQVMAQAGSNQNLDLAMVGVGGQRSWWTEQHGAQASLGTELRVERYQGRDSLAGSVSPLAHPQAWMVRPWIRAQAGFRGILLPLPRGAAEVLAWVTQGGPYTHPFTRLEVAVPLWHQGGRGPSGLLRQMAPRWEGSLQFGMRFGAAPLMPMPPSLEES